MRRLSLKTAARRLLRGKESPAAPGNPAAALEVQQSTLVAGYVAAHRRGDALPDIREAGFRVYSEADEDGILLFLLALCGIDRAFVVDIGAGGIVGSNSANLILHRGFDGLLIEGNTERAARLRRFYAEHPATRNHPPKVVATRVGREDIDGLIRQYTDETDVLCIDVDGVDYWLWKAIESVRPRVVVVEVQAIWSAQHCVTVPYRSDFEPTYAGQFGVHSGASLAAFVKLGREKGYRLVGTQRHGYNAFFVRDDLATGALAEVSAEQCLSSPFARWARERFGQQIRRYEWQDV